MPEKTYLQKLEFKEQRLLKLIHERDIMNFVAEFLRRKLRDCRVEVQREEERIRFAGGEKNGETESYQII